MYLELEIKEGNEVKIVIWLLRITHFAVFFRKCTCDLCGPNFARHRSEVHVYSIAEFLTVGANKPQVVLDLEIEKGKVIDQRAHSANDLLQF